MFVLHGGFKDLKNEQSLCICIHSLIVLGCVAALEAPRGAMKQLVLRALEAPGAEALCAFL